MNKQEMVIFYDGVCNLCNFSVNSIIKIDKKRKFKFSSLQSNYAKSTLPVELTELVNSIVLLSNGKIYIKAEAVILILKHLGGSYNIFAKIISLFPLSFMNWIYNYVAKNRFRFFSKKNSCRIPTEEESKYFIE